MESELSEDELLSVINHVFLPPKLPQSEDPISDTAILSAIGATGFLKELAHHLPTTSPDALRKITALLKNLHAIHQDDDGVVERGIRTALSNLAHGETIPIKVSAQNAAVLITRDNDSLIFEGFELSPPNAAVYSTAGRLVRTFPGHAAKVSASLLRTADFMTTLTSMLTTMSTQPVAEAQQQTRKAETLHEEDRDTASPLAISALLFGILRGLGNGPHESSTIVKKTREEVMWNQSRRPWRRSAMWMLFRVALQLTIVRSADGSHELYKVCMAFFASRVLKLCISHDLPAETLYIMGTKLDRKRSKLLAADCLPEWLDFSIGSVLKRSTKVIELRWTDIQLKDARQVDLTSLATLNFDADTRLDLPGLDAHIEGMLSRDDDHSVDRFRPRTTYVSSNSHGPPALPSDSDAEQSVASLRDLERWVEQDLEGWRSTIPSPESACQEIRAVMERYHSLASNVYADNPEGQSILLLTLLELWKAIDESAIELCPFLEDYALDMPVDSLQNLLLPSLDQLKRLSKIEDYLNRRDHEKLPASQLFDTRSPRSLAVRFYDKSDLHKELHANIVSAADVDREAKLSEFKTVQSQAVELAKLINNLDCEYIKVVVKKELESPVTGEKLIEEVVEEKHSRACQKCLNERQLNKLSIAVFEEWLPGDPNRAKTVVFELQVPSFIADWRTMKFFMLPDVFWGYHEGKPLPFKFSLSSNDPFLSKRFIYQKGDRVCLVSESKPVTATHYKGKMITSISVDNVFVNNGLRYRYYDSDDEDDIGEPFMFEENRLWSCTYQLHRSILHQNLFRTAAAPDGLPPNHVIAGQHSHPEDMSFSEFHELATLPFGHHIVWQNVLLQLAMPGVDLAKPDTTMFILQSIYQAGPPSPTGHHLRQSHGVLQSPALAFRILEQVAISLERIRGNWEQSMALSGCISITSRTLSLCSATKDVCLGLLKTARLIAHAWSEKLRDRAHDAESTAHRDEYLAKAFEVALTLSSTFDADDIYLPELLQSSGDVTMLIQASIDIFDGARDFTDPEAFISLMLLRHKRLLHRCYRIVSLDSAALDAAVQHAWSAFQPDLSGPGWHVASSGNERWLTTKTLSDAQGKASDVYYDVLSGELLVRGLGTNQLPHRYLQGHSYDALFGDAVVEVMPASLPGFAYSTRRPHKGFAVEIGMLNERIAIRATGPGGSFETVPSEVLSEDILPSHFCSSYVLWYNFSTKSVDLRPAGDPWSPSSLWSLSKRGTYWELTDGNVSVVDLQSPTAKALSTILEPLADASHVHYFHNEKERLLEVRIPSLRLSFVLDRGCSRLTSREYRDMSVDHDQGAGSLIGFVNKLVLKAADGRRTALVLAASLEYKKQDQHVRVHAIKGDGNKVYALDIDESLCRFKDNGDLSCKLYLAHLHALTASCLPDPLIQRTGTAQALHILRSQAVRSFSELPQADIDRLASIAEVSPTRCFYPPKTGRMQQVDWNDELSSIAQSDDFFLVVGEILEQQLTMIEDFFPDSEIEIPDMDDISPPDCLLHRNRHGHHASLDREYKSRDAKSHQSAKTENIAVVAGLLRRKTATKHCTSSFLEPLWQLLVKCGRIGGPEVAPDRLLDISEMRYSSALLKSFEKNVSTLFGLLESLRDPPSLDKHQFTVVVWLCCLMLDTDASFALVQCIAMGFAGLHGSLTLPAPAPQTYQGEAQNILLTGHGKEFQRTKIEKIVEAQSLRFEECPEFKWQQKKGESKKAFDHRRQQAWKKNSKAIVMQTVDSFQAQWPVQVPSESWVPTASSYLLTGAVLSNVRNQFQIWYDNGLLYAYLGAMQEAVDRLPIDKVELPACTLRLEVPRPSLPGYMSEAPLMPPSNSRLRPLITRLRSPADRSDFEVEYAKDLDDSLQALLAREEPSWGADVPDKQTLQEHHERCQHYADKLYCMLVDAIMSNPRASRSCQAQTLPRVTSSLLIAQLARGRWPLLSTAWQRSIVTYGIALTMVQRAARLLQLSGEDLRNELIEQGHTNWDPHQYPESLLVEVESSLLIRERQERIAAQMRKPSSGSNAVCQLNMGEGKSSVIIPIVAAALADGSSLVCVVVGKPQSKQAEQMMVSKLGGLCDRRVYFFPFSRDVKLSIATASRIRDMLLKCMQEGGILLVQAAHLLSFRLIGLELLLRDKSAIAAIVNSTCNFLDQRSRILVDEVDENLAAARLELIYTIGSQHVIEMGPRRWALMHQVLELVRRLAPKVAAEMPLSVELREVTKGSFPFLRILHPDASEKLIALLAEEIGNDGLECFGLHRQPKEVQQAVRTYITKYELSPAEVVAVEKGPMWRNDDSRRHLLLLRGILACGILAFVFGGKRYRVDFGLATRSPPTLLAVPYLAKDSPNPRSEFSHPDTTILLTSLSYYYGGLTDSDLTAAFQHLTVQSSQSAAEYALWVADSPELPIAFRDLSGVNLKDLQHVFSCLRRSKRVIDYYLTNLVFPRFMKQFPNKLSASGWDIGKTRPRFTTGFSGTIDTRCLLPLGMQFLDLDDQKHTNALVLENLLKPEHGLQTMSYAGASDLLSRIMQLDPPVQVVLDVGAQIIELSNLAMAEAWLKASPESKEAVVFVDDKDELQVLDRAGRIEWFQSSSYQARLDLCLVFLDQSHTRGIDLKMPVNFRAAVTLGARLTKDSLVQACMRLRKLGKGQTVVFCVPDEVQTKIRESLDVESAAPLVLEDILLWSMNESLNELRRQMPLWATQGRRFASQNSIWEAARDESGDVALGRNDATQYLEQEAQSLEKRYRPRLLQAASVPVTNTSDPDIIRIDARCRMVDRMEISSNSFHEEQEQERELAPEIEREKEIQPKLNVRPLPHDLHEDVVKFALEGELDLKSPAYTFAFSVVPETNIDSPFPFKSLLDATFLATKDFTLTVSPAKVKSKTKRATQNPNTKFRDFQRPVRWMLIRYSKSAKKLGIANCIMLVSPFEANALHALMGPDSGTTLHLYKARVKPGFAPLDGLSLYTFPAMDAKPLIPPRLLAQLNLFAGQLYLSSYEDYLGMCQFLGISTTSPDATHEEQGIKLDAQGFICYERDLNQQEGQESKVNFKKRGGKKHKKHNAKENGQQHSVSQDNNTNKENSGKKGGTGRSNFTKNPNAFFKAWLTLRNQGLSIEKTHMHDLLSGRVFREADFDG